MVDKSWGTLTPECVSEHITYDLECEDWTYRSSDTSMPARQAEGVAGIWNKLSRQGVALLADEVGTGKTLQALGVMARLWQMKPGARVLIMAPNRSICQQWEREYAGFVEKHYRDADDLVRSKNENKPVHKAHLVWSLKDLAEAASEGSHQLLITTIYSLSGLVAGEGDKDIDKSKAAAGKANDIRKQIKKSLGDRGFDLLIVDEAHYFRNSKGSTQRANAGREFFGPARDRLADRALLMTATPSHKSTHDIQNILSYVTDDSSLSSDKLLKKYALRRLRRMSGQNGITYDKYSYRNELAVEANFDNDPAAELFFALYQKRLVQEQAKEGRRFLYGYLEGFESFDVPEPAEPKVFKQEEPDQAEEAKASFKSARDSDILKELVRELGALPAHPKYDELVKICVPEDIFNATVDVHEHKHLVFVRRIASVREIANRVNAAYDQQMGKRIADALAPNDKEKLKQWQDQNLSREAFNNIFLRQAQSDAIDSVGGNDQTSDDGIESHTDTHSQVSNLFVVKSSGTDRSTDCSNFSLRLRKPESVFSLLLEPASDYEMGTYSYYGRKTSGGIERDDYTSATLRARRGEPQGNGGLFKNPMPTLWGLMYGHLDGADKDRIKKLLQPAEVSDPAPIESFAQYLKNGFLFASPVLIELYCWYAEFRRLDDAKNKGDAQERYLSFLKFIEKKIRNSLALAYFRAALETFKPLHDNWESHREKGWSLLKGLSSPAFFASGEVTDRERLILGFNTPFYPNVLATTSVLQEGVNLHMQCRKVHHYGIAWTPGDNEQRVGRVDRLFGKVNAQLVRDGKAELTVHYPYLARSFDEDQLASFIRHKHTIEERMDACRESNNSQEIDIRNSSENWKSYLRKPKNNESLGQSKDPFPYDPEEAQPW